MMQDMITRKDNLKRLILDAIEHSYLQQFIVLPTLDEDKLLLLIELVDQLILTNEEKEKLVITTTLIQIALDTHEAITNENLTGVENKSRQLSILAGTYYSGLYYSILSNMNDVYYTRQLAIGIKEVNEHKITLYQNAAESQEELINDLLLIESALLDKISQSISQHWFELSRNVVLFNRLLKEENLYKTTGQSSLYKTLYLIHIGSEWPSFVDEKSNHMLSKIFNQQLNNVKQIIITCLNNMTVSNELKSYIESKLIS